MMFTVNTKNAEVMRTFQPYGTRSMDFSSSLLPPPLSTPLFPTPHLSLPFGRSLVFHCLFFFSRIEFEAQHSLAHTVVEMVCDVCTLLLLHMPVRFILFMVSIIYTLFFSSLLLISWNEVSIKTFVF